MAKGKRPRPAPRAVSALQTRVEKLLRGVHPELRVHPVGDTVLVSVGLTGVAQVGETRLRILPGREWARLSLGSHEAHLVRERISAAISASAEGSDHFQSLRGLREWADALTARGVPATVEGRVVVVAGVGAVPMPAPGRPVRVAAKRLVRAQTELVAPWLLGRVRAAAGGRDPRVRVKESRGRILVRLGSEHVATVTRYSVTVIGEAPVYGDLRVDDRALSAIAVAVNPVRRGVPAVAAVGSDEEASKSAATAGSDDESGSAAGPAPLVLVSLADVVAFLREAGLAVTTPTDVWLAVAGIEARPPSSVIGDRVLLGHWLDALVADRLSGYLASAVSEIVAEHPPLRVVMDDGDAVIVEPSGERRARITATRVQLPDTTSFEGNFLTGGEQWSPLESILEDLAERLENAPVAEPGLHRWLPEPVDPELAAAMHEASRRLREERTRAFEHAIRVDVGDASLQFSPVTFREGRPVVPFVHEHRGVMLEGALRLGALDELMACYWHQQADPDTFVLVWALALDAYAEISCLPRPTATTKPAGGPSLPSSCETVSRTFLLCLRARTGGRIPADVATPSRRWRLQCGSGEGQHRRAGSRRRSSSATCS